MLPPPWGALTIPEDDRPLEGIIIALGIQETALRPRLHEPFQNPGRQLDLPLPEVPARRISPP